MSNIKYTRREKIDINVINELSKELNLSPLIVEFMYSKGYKTKDDIDYFINFNESNLRNVNEMLDVDKFLSRVTKAIENKENIVIYGDYDADGVASTAIFVRTLRLLGGNVNYFTNNKYKEGYGLCEAGIDRLIKKYPDTDLIITCDNGIAAIPGIKYAKEIGLEVIVTDHHNALPEGTLPDAIVVSETRLDEDRTRLEGFCGTELVRRLCLALVRHLNLEDKLKDKMRLMYIYSGIATVTDVIPLNASNHFILKKSLEIINEIPLDLPFVKVFFDMLGIKEKCTEYEYGFKIGPILNACTRILGEPELAIEFFISDDIVTTNNLLTKLMEINQLRISLVNEFIDYALKEYEEKKMVDDKVIVLTNYNDKYYPESIAGIIAGRMMETYNKPTIVLAKVDDKDIYVGSARSIEGVDLYTPTYNIKDLLLTFGGHAEAYGLSIDSSKVDEFKVKINSAFSEVDFPPKTKELFIVANINLLPFDDNEVLLNTLKPFGKCFTKPLYSTFGFFDYKINAKFPKDVLAKIRLINGNNTLETIYFTSEAEFDKLDPYMKKVTIIGDLDINRYKSYRTNQFKINDIVFLDNK